jgi:hypothetical protein
MFLLTGAGEPRRTWHGAGSLAADARQQGLPGLLALAALFLLAGHPLRMGCPPASGPSRTVRLGVGLALLLPRRLAAVGTAKERRPTRAGIGQGGGLPAVVASDRDLARSRTSCSGYRNDKNPLPPA